MALKVYGHSISQPSRAVLIFLKANNIEHEFVSVDLMKGEQRKPEFLAVNPLGQIPTLSDGDFNLSESSAILTYLHTTRHTPDHWYPADPQKRALVDRYLHWHHNNLHKAALVLYGQVFLPLFGASMPEAILNDALECRRKSFTQVDTWLTEHPYIAGNELTIADLPALCEITNHRLVDFDLSPYPHIQAWITRLFEIPAVAELHVPLDQFKAYLEKRAALKVYSNPISQPGRAVLIFLKANNIPHEFAYIDLLKGDQKKPEFLSRFPLGQVPAISDKDFNLSESHAILTYLHTTRQTPDHWYPIDPQKRALVDRYLHWHHNNLRKASLVVYGEVYAPMMGTALHELFQIDALETRAKSFAQVESWLNENPYIAGNEVSIADLSALCEITTHKLTAFDYSPYPHIQAWITRMFQIPAVAELHVPLDQVKAMLQVAGRKGVDTQAL